ncbi:MAG: hypothetical protein HFE76_10375 [Firmicutes bacterium]|nr:hypothetical protein [Bacillota bacterium]
MGTIVKSACAKCGYEEELQVGGGMRDCEAETALAIANNDPELAGALSQKAMFRIDRGICVCRSCQKLVAAAIVTYRSGNGKTRTITGKCPDCKGELTWPDTAAEDIPCPVCGAGMTFQTVGHWD